MNVGNRLRFLDTVLVGDLNERDGQLVGGLVVHPQMDSLLNRQPEFVRQIAHVRTEFLLPIEVDLQLVLALPDQVDPPLFTVPIQSFE